MVIGIIISNIKKKNLPFETPYMNIIIEICTYVINIFLDKLLKSIATSKDEKDDSSCHCFVLTILVCIIYY